MTPFHSSRSFLRANSVSVHKRSGALPQWRRSLLTAVSSLAAAALPYTLLAQGDMESDLQPNTTLFFEELLPSHVFAPRLHD